MAKKQYYCDYGKIDSRNGVVYLLCTKSGKACGYQRYCTNDQCIKHTNNFVDCGLRKEVDARMRRKNRHKNRTVGTQVTVNKNVIENVGEDMRTTKRCKVILVTPDYFLVDNGGYAKRVQGKTDLKKGDWYVLELAPEKKEVVIEEKVEATVVEPVMVEEEVKKEIEEKEEIKEPVEEKIEEVINIETVENLDQMGE